MFRLARAMEDKSQSIDDKNGIKNDNGKIVFSDMSMLNFPEIICIYVLSERFLFWLIRSLRSLKKILKPQNLKAEICIYYIFIKLEENHQIF